MDDENGSGIEVFLRLKPSKVPSGYFSRDDLDENIFICQIPKSDDQIVNNSKSRHVFKFNHILEDNVNQDDVFRAVGAPAVQNALDGFNSTVFAYGQTGSGKTFTITGGAGMQKQFMQLFTTTSLGINTTFVFVI